MSLRILIASDLHLEHLDGQEFLKLTSTIPDESEYDAVVLAGDIGSWTQGIEFAKGFNKPAFVTFGNHEYYGRDYLDLRFMFSGNNHGNAHLLCGGEFYDLEHDGKTYRFIGGTLWSECQLEGYSTNPQYIEASIADFKLIKFGKQKMNAELMRRICQEEKRGIENSLATSIANHNIVFTHFMPTVEACKRGSYNGDPLNPYFATYCDDIMDKYTDFIDYWIFGHTHDRMEFEHPIFGTKLISNPLGYPGENPEPYEWKIITIEDYKNGFGV